jgi:putative resolvase
MNDKLSNPNISGQHASFVTPKEATRILGIPGTTLRLWAENGDIDCIRKNGAGTKRYYDVYGFLKKRNASIPTSGETKINTRVVYARVSNSNQLDDLERQKKYLLDRFPEHDVITDISDGLTFDREGIKTILDRALQGTITELVVTHQDRLCRFGFELLKFILEEKCSVKIVVLNNLKSTSQEELVTDLLSIITQFSARATGLRKYKQEITNDYLVNKMVED